MKLQKRLSFWLFLTLLVVAGSWWLLYVPYHPERVFAAIPQNATVVSVQQNLAGEWRDLRKNPFILNGLQAAGVSEADIAATATNDVIQAWGERLASDLSAIAYIPSLDGQQKPALVCASWIGGQSRRLRWQLSWLKSRDLRPIKLNNGHLTVWVTRTKFGKSDLRLSLALSEGLVLACISEDPVGVRALLETAEHYPGRHSLADTDRPAQALSFLEGKPRHWGWFSIDNNLMAYTFDLTAQGFSVDITGHSSLRQAPALKDIPSLKTANAMAGANSDLAVLMPLTWLTTLAPKNTPQFWLNDIIQLTNPSGAPADALAFVALLDQRHNGRLRGPMGPALRAFIKGIKTPTLLMGLQLGSEAEATNRIKLLVDQLNSQYNLSLTIRSVEQEGEPPITLIEESRKSFYGSFEPDERVAFIHLDGWLILASHAGVLKQILKSPPGEPPVWQSAAASGASATLYGNLDGLGQTVKNASGVLKLVSLFDSSQDSPKTRAALGQTAFYSGIARAFGQIQASMSNSNGTTRVKVTLGKP